MSKQLTQEVNSDSVDVEVPLQNKKEKRSLQSQLEEVKKKKKKILYFLKKVLRKIIIQVATKTCTPKTR